MSEHLNANSEKFGYVDAHLHVDLYPEQEQLKLLQNAFDHGVDAVVAVSMHHASSLRNRELAAHFPGRVMPAYGFHPEQELPSKEEADALLAWMDRCVKEGEHFAVGEVGLPYYKRTEAEAAGERLDESGYISLLERFVSFAAERDLPIVLHAVYEDAEKALDLLDKYDVPRAHFHWFKGSERAIKRMIDRGCMISVTPDVVYEPEIQALVDRYPIGLMMTETDGPWPFEGPFEGRPTEPAMVIEVARAIARIKGMDAEEAVQQLYRNAVQFYGLSSL